MTPGSAKPFTKRQRYEILRAQLDAERSTFIPHWRDLSDYILPRRARFTITDVNKGDRRNLKIYDNTGTVAARTLRAGMMSGVTSPARPWFRLTTPDPDLAKFGRVKDWLFAVQEIMATSFLKSNLYTTLPVQYGDLGTFATAAMSVEEDFTGDVFNTQSFPVGSYMIAKDAKGRVNTYVRDFRMTVRQLVREFGKMKDGQPDWSVFSTHVRNQWDNAHYEAWIDVCHVIEPNNDYDPTKMESKNKKFSSCYYERGTSTGANYLQNEDSERYLRESGYEYFPVLVPRWEVTGEDVWGTDCPGMTVLGDIKQLQLGEKRIFEAIEKMIRPPMTGPTSMKNHAASILPGDITYVDAREGVGGFRPAHEVNQFRIDHMETKQEQCRGRIRRGYYEDLFLMLANDERSGITAREINERHEEKLLALGPVLEQLNQDQLDPLIDIAFDIHLRQRLLPPPPEELTGMPLKVEYISVMAQAQKLVGIGGVDRFTGYVGNIAAYDQRVLKKVKTDKLVDIYADMTSIPPNILRTDEEVAALEAQEQQAAAAQQKMEMMGQLSKSARDLAQADLGKDNALNGVLDSARAAQAGNE